MRLQITDAVKHLLIINVVMFVGTIAVQNGVFFNKNFALYNPMFNYFKPWQIITHMFMHGGIAHLFFNMFALWMFGSAVEQQLGTKKFLFIYFSAGIGAMAFQLGYNYFNFYSAADLLTEYGISIDELVSLINSNTLNLDKVQEIIGSDALRTIEDSFYSRMLGASGCIMGILAAFGVMNPNAELMLIFLPVPIKAKYFIPGIILLDVISAITGQSFFSPSNTAYMAHVGGAVIGFLIMWYWKKNSMNKYRWN